MQRWRNSDAIAGDGNISPPLVMNISNRNKHSLLSLPGGRITTAITKTMINTINHNNNHLSLNHVVTGEANESHSKCLPTENSWLDNYNNYVPNRGLASEFSSMFLLRNSIIVKSQSCCSSSLTHAIAKQSSCVYSAIAYLCFASGLEFMLKQFLRVIDLLGAWPFRYFFSLS